MKRKLQYVAADGKVFDDRASAVRHDTDLERRKRLTRFFQEILDMKADDAVITRQKLVAGIAERASHFASVLSARAARRTMLNAARSVAQRKATLG